MTEKPEIKLVVLDVDGTILDSKHTLPNRTLRAMQATLAQGVPIVLATGKTRAAVENILDPVGLKTPGVYNQGLAIYDATGVLKHQQTLDATLARRVITYAEERGFLVFAYSGTDIFIRSANPALEEGLTRYHERAPKAVGPLQNLLPATQFNKLVVIGDPRAIKALRWQLNLQVGGAGRVIQAGVPEMLEVMPPGASKGAGVRWLLRDMGIDPRHVLAIGDAENDIEMLQMVGVAVAVANASDALKAVAQHIVASSDESGVAEALERFVLTAPLDPPPAPTPEPEAIAEKTPDSPTVEGTNTDANPTDAVDAKPAAKPARRTKKSSTAADDSSETDDDSAAEEKDA